MDVDLISRGVPLVLDLTIGAATHELSKASPRRRPNTPKIQQAGAKSTLLLLASIMDRSIPVARVTPVTPISLERPPKTPKASVVMTVLCTAPRRHKNFGPAFGLILH